MRSRSYALIPSLVTLILLTTACQTDIDSTEDAIAPEMSDADAGEDTNSPPDMKMSSGGDMEMGMDPTDDGGETPPPEGLTYYEHIRPILSANCVECHTGGGIAPFALETYEEVAPLASVIANSVETGAMPPWMPQEGCGDFKHKRSLSVDEIETLRTWATGDKAKGDPDDEPVRVIDDEETVTFGAPDVTYSLDAPYTPTPDQGETDDFRCFVFETDFDETRYINGARFTPGNLEIAHHMIMFAITPDQLQTLRQRDAAEEAPGYTCYGGPGVGGAQNIGTWVPGSQPLVFDEGIGVELPAGSGLVVQMHYNTTNDPGGSDQFDLDLRFVDGVVETVLVNFGLLDASFVIPPGEEEGVAGRTVPVPNGATVHGIMPHMHSLGAKIRVWYETADEPDGCMIDVPQWNYDWQNFYMYDEPFTIPPGSRLHLECTFDNSADNQPYGRQPREVRWGDGTFDEMCLTFFMIEQ